MIESAQALSNVDEIAAVPGLGMLFVGPFDLSLSLGIDVPTSPPTEVRWPDPGGGHAATT